MSIILIGYGLFLLVLAGVAVAAVYHALNFGFPGDRTRLAAGIYVITCFAILIVSLVLIVGADFSEVTL